MVRKKLDERIRTLLERGVVTGQRSMLVIVGDHGKDQIPNLHQLLTKTSVRARPKVLWCYKKELGFSSHRKKVRKFSDQRLKIFFELTLLFRAFKKMTTTELHNLIF